MAVASCELAQIYLLT